MPADGLYCVHMNKSDNTSCLLEQLEHFCWSSVSPASKQCLPCPVRAFNRLLPTQKDLELSEKVLQGQLTQPPVSGSTCGFGSCKNKLEASFHHSAFPNCNSAELNTLSVCLEGCDVEKEKKGDTDVVISNEAEQTKATTPCNKPGSQPMLGDNSTLKLSAVASAELNMTCKELEGECAVENPHKPRKVLNCVSLREKKCDASLAMNCVLSEVGNMNSEAHQLIFILGEAVKKRVFNLPRADKESCRFTQQLSPEAGGDLRSESSPHPRNQATAADCSQERCKPADVGILFSGGIDSMVVAALADRLVNRSVALYTFIVFPLPCVKHMAQISRVFNLI